MECDVWVDRRTISQGAEKKIPCSGSYLTKQHSGAGGAARGASKARSSCLRGKGGGGGVGGGVTCDFKTRTGVSLQFT